MAIKNLVTPERVLCNVSARSKKHVLDIISELLAGTDMDLTQTEVIDCLVQRERLGSTCLGQGAAIPHGRLEALASIQGVFLRLTEALDFDANDGLPVDLVFGMLVPADCGDAYLDDLSIITEMLSSPDTRDLLRKAASSRALYDLLIGAEDEKQASA